MNSRVLRKKIVYCALVSLSFAGNLFSARRSVPLAERQGLSDDGRERIVFVDRGSTFMQAFLALASNPLVVAGVGSISSIGFYRLWQSGMLIDIRQRGLSMATEIGLLRTEAASNQVLTLSRFDRVDQRFDGLEAGAERDRELATGRYEEVRNGFAGLNDRVDVMAQAQAAFHERQKEWNAEHGPLVHQLLGQQEQDAVVIRRLEGQLQVLQASQEQLMQNGQANHAALQAEIAVVQSGGFEVKRELQEARKENAQLRANQEEMIRNQEQMMRMMATLVTLQGQNMHPELLSKIQKSMLSPLELPTSLPEDFIRKEFPSALRFRCNSVSVNPATDYPLEREQKRERLRSMVRGNGAYMRRPGAVQLLSVVSHFPALNVTGVNN